MSRPSWSAKSRTLVHVLNARHACQFSGIHDSYGPFRQRGSCLSCRVTCLTRRGNCTSSIARRATSDRRMPVCGSSSMKAPSLGECGAALMSSLYSCLVRTRGALSSAVGGPASERCPRECSPTRRGMRGATYRVCPAIAGGSRQATTIQFSQLLVQVTRSQDR